VLHGPGFICDGERTWEASFFSNINSAVRRAVFKAVPFRDVEYAQDQAFAADLHAAGFLIAYAPLAAVLHSHDYPIRTYFARMVDEFHGLRSTLGHAPRVGLAPHAGAALIGTLRDAASAALDREYTPAERVRGILSAPAYQVARRLATAVGRARSRRMAEHFSFDRRRRHAAAE
jgi:rhamnosyltransferase